MPCQVWDYFFQQVDPANLGKIQFFANSQFNEIGWYFPIKGGNGENSNYIKFNTLEGEWDYGPLGRSCWIDQSILGAPLAGAISGIIYQHEVSPDADGIAMNPFVQLGDFTPGKVEHFMIIHVTAPQW